MNQASDKNDRPLKLRDLVSLEGRVVAIHPAGVVSFQVLGASGDILDFKVRAADVEVVVPPTPAVLEENLDGSQGPLRERQDTLS